MPRLALNKITVIILSNGKVPHKSILFAGFARGHTSNHGEKFLGSIFFSGFLLVDFFSGFALCHTSNHGEKSPGDISLCART